MKVNIWLFPAALAIVLIFLGSLSFAQEDKEDRKVVRRVMNGISGEVSAVSKDFIAIVYRRDEAGSSEEEMAFPIAKDAVVEHKRSLSDIGVGDLVDVEFEELSEETKEGVRSQRKVKVVRFVRAAPRPQDTGVLGSGEQEEEEAEEQ